VTAESGRRLGERELQLAQELGARAGVAVENAMLYDSADERRAELDAVLSAMAEPVLVFSPAGDLRLANPAAHALFEGDVPKSVIDLRAALLPADDQPAPRRSRTLAQLEGEVQLRATGRWYELRRYESARSQADAASRRPPTVIMLRDVTAERAARSAREAFLGLLSHELRTPITTIYAGSEMLERSVDDATRAEVARDIQAEAERLNRLVEDLLVLTRVERGGVEVGDEPVLIQRVLPRLIESLVRRYPGLTVELEVAEAVPSVRGDMTYIEQVLRNLLTNAVRYAEALERGVTTSVAEEDGRVVVRVMDRGPGLGDDEASRVFELFYRAPSARKVPGGAGIGLFVCRHLVEAMGGTMWARQRAGGGAEFGFALPVLEGDPAG
jgi:two-component system, OmpR family, phosphate regulon sensor histidine kinase PhoR